MGYWSGFLSGAAIDAGLPDRDVPLLVLDPGVRDRLFAAVRALGVWTWRRPGPG